MIDLPAKVALRGRIQGVPPLQPEEAGRGKAASRIKEEFARALQGAKSELRFSAHALERMQQRGIELSRTELDRMQDAVQTAAGKGSRSSLVLLDERAFVISVASRTVITAMESESLKDRVVTEIDSTVILH